jgi:hypothetical protein
MLVEKVHQFSLNIKLQILRTQLVKNKHLPCSKVKYNHESKSSVVNHKGNNAKELAIMEVPIALINS